MLFKTLNKFGQFSMKGIATRVILVLSSLLICLILAEAVARQGLSHVSRRSVSLLNGSLETDPELLIEYTAKGRRFVPDADVVIHNHYISGQDVAIKTNSLGLRNREISPLPEEESERILFIGDSIVVQDYLPSEHTSAQMLENYLIDRLPGGVEVVNAGLSNFGIEEEYQLLSDIISRVNPTKVLLSFYLNDSRPAWGFSGEIGEKRGWLRKHSIIVETVMRELEIRNWLASSKVDRFSWLKLVDTLPWLTSPVALRQIAESAPYDWGSAWQDESWRVVDATLEKIKQLTIGHGAQLLVLAMPIRYQVDADYVEDSPQRKLAEITRDKSLPFLSPLPQLREFRQEDLFYDWCHPTERGNSVIVPVIGEFLLKNIEAKGRLGDDKN